MKNSRSNSKPIAPARRLDSVKEYYFSKKLKEIAQLNANGADIISLGIGGPDRPPHRDVIDTLCSEAAVPSNHSYQPYVGIPQLRQAFAAWYLHYYGVSLDANTEIQPLIGSKEGILHTTLAFVNPGDGVLVPNPGYPTYSSVSRLAEAEIFTYDLLESNNWQPDFDQLEAMPLDKIKLMWVNYPNMPTGAQASMELFQRLVDFGKRHGIVIVNDNPYSFILHEKPLSILSVPGAKDIAIEMNSMSKSHNMAGWRIGMLASNPQFIQWILKVKSNIDSGQFKPMMLAAVKALEAPDSWYEDVNATYSRRRKIAEKIMATLGCSFDPRQGGLFLWGKIADDMESAEAVSDMLLYDARVFITPGFIFGSNGNRYIRISLCATEEKMNEALERIIEMKNKQ
ncbi:MAG: aminotransferase class I/II-fold pyridoxal phosphate-dependent enzyme [Bacteroidales bacterium]|nr:aminotransferase class I/II-fold pyridoxal phosphate-dependent enzyme [Bacteroidales bacterium]MDY2932280.1 aminotransferase class I/II-fold pyridoxal phosphate-dependent enzyme [Muribaculaceae bacterium]